MAAYFGNCLLWYLHISVFVLTDLARNVFCPHHNNNSPRVFIFQSMSHHVQTLFIKPLLGNGIGVVFFFVFINWYILQLVFYVPTTFILLAFICQPRPCPNSRPKMLLTQVTARIFRSPQPASDHFQPVAMRHVLALYLLQLIYYFLTTLVSCAIGMLCYCHLLLSVYSVSMGHDIVMFCSLLQLAFVGIASFFFVIIYVANDIFCNRYVSHLYFPQLLFFVTDHFVIGIFLHWYFSHLQCRN